MRYYKIIISTPPVPGSSSVAGSATAGTVTVTAAQAAKVYETFSSVTASGANDPGALNVELDLSVAGIAQPMGPTQASVRIWGPSIKQIGQQSDLTGKRIQVFGGMGRGLPLANRQAQQQGLLVSGVIYQAFANWIGTDMTLDMTLAADTGAAAPLNLTNVWLANMPLADAIRNTLRIAYPDFTPVINISDRLVFNADQIGAYSTLPQLAQWIKDRSKSLIGDPAYQGVDIVFRDKMIYVFDGSTKTAPFQLEYADLVGQPTWQNAPSIQITTVMRGDLAVSDYIRLPKGSLTTANAQQIGSSQFIGFQGVFQIYQLRHVGNFRQPSGDSWVTVIDAYPQDYLPAGP